MQNVFKVYLSKLYLGTYIADSKYEAIERAKRRFEHLNTQTNTPLWKSQEI